MRQAQTVRGDRRLTYPLIEELVVVARRAVRGNRRTPEDKAIVAVLVVVAVVHFLTVSGMQIETEHGTAVGCERAVGAQRM